jgi:hypothetical protein
MGAFRQNQAKPIRAGIGLLLLMSYSTATWLLKRLSLLGVRLSQKIEFAFGCNRPLVFCSYCLR